MTATESLNDAVLRQLTTYYEGPVQGLLIRLRKEFPGEIVVPSNRFAKADSRDPSFINLRIGEYVNVRLVIRLPQFKSASTTPATGFNEASWAASIQENTRFQILDGGVMASKSVKGRKLDDRTTKDMIREVRELLALRNATKDRNLAVEATADRLEAFMRRSMAKAGWEVERVSVRLPASINGQVASFTTYLTHKVSGHKQEITHLHYADAPDGELELDNIKFHGQKLKV